MQASRDYWAPHVTVATLIERNGRYLMVEERGPAGETVINQPAGHLDPHESLIDAAVREVREETGHVVRLTGLTGIYQWEHPDSGEQFLRICFAGSVADGPPAHPVDEPDILGQLWLSREQIEQLPAERLRSPLVLRCLRDHGRGVSLPLSALNWLERAPS